MIKYRQPLFNQDGTFKEWHYWGTNLEYGGAVSNIGWMTKQIPLCDPAQSLQSTGMIDKNEQEIFEGDIDEYGHIVSWHGGAGCWALTDKVGRIMTYPIYDRNITVSGNIYETPIQ